MSIRCFFNHHAWDGCVCSRCGAKRDQDHAWDGCVCSRCGAENHDFEEIEKDEYTPTCCYSASDPCTGPNCGTWCDSYPGPGYSYVRLRCRRCGKVEERGERAEK